MTVRLPAGVRHLDGFQVASRYGLAAPGGVEGAGRGVGGTVLRVDDRTSTSRRFVPKERGATNPLYVVRATGAAGVVVAGLTVDGGVQGHLYNGVRVEKTDRPVIRDVRVVRVPGDADVPPGETFDLNLWRCAAPSLADVELDGAGVGASGVGYNSCSGGTTARVTAHHHPHCKAFALWQHAGGHTFTRVESLHNAFAFGFERCAGTYVLDRVKVRGSTRADVHLASDTTRAKVHVVDPDLGTAGHLTVLLSRTEMGKPNRQREEDVTLTVAGRERRDLLRFVTHA